jgi:hypothetical protein
MGDILAISKGRHPIFSAKKTSFVENDVFVDNSCNIQIITGPNMVSSNLDSESECQYFPYLRSEFRVENPHT